MPEFSGVKGDSAQGKLGWAGWESLAAGCGDATRQAAKL